MGDRGWFHAGDCVLCVGDPMNPTQKIKAKLASLEAMERAASPGPWFNGYWSGQCHENHLHTGQGSCKYKYEKRTENEYSKQCVSSGAVENMELISGIHPPNAAFIAAAKSEFPSLLSTISELVEALEDVLENSVSKEYAREVAKDALDRAGERLG